MKLTSTPPGALVAAVCLTPVLFGLPGDRDTELVSLTTAGLQPTFRSNFPAISANGRVVAFESSADDLVPGDTNFSKDIFVRDLDAGTTTRVSVSSAGAQGNHHSVDPTISDDGRYVAFSSRASNLVAGDNNFLEDVFVHDRDTGTTTRVSLGLLGAQLDAYAFQPFISPDGSCVAYTSAATNVVAGITNSDFDIFLRDLGSGATTRVSVSSVGAEGDANSLEPALSQDGQIVTFYSLASTLIGTDTNGQPDVYVHDVASGQTTRVSESTAGMQGNSYSQFPRISADGRYVAFESRATTLVPNDLNSADDVFLHDRMTGTTSIVSVSSNGVYGNAASRDASISADGRHIAYLSWSTNLIASDTNFHIDIFVHDRIGGTTRRVSLGDAGQAGNGHAIDADISADGRWVAFQSGADNLVPVDTNGFEDLFVHDSLGAAAVSTRNAGANPASYTAGTPVLGALWSASVDLTTTGHTTAQVLGTTAPTNLTLGGGQVLLVSGPQIFLLPPQSGPLAIWLAPLPDDPSLAGFTVFTQAVHLFGVTPFALSNAQDLCLGY